jgi:hypothetical protein
MRSNVWNGYYNDRVRLMPKLQETKGRFFLTIPKAMVERKQWAKGKELVFTWNERGHIEIHD